MTLPDFDVGIERVVLFYPFQCIKNFETIDSKTGGEYSIGILVAYDAIDDLTSYGTILN